MIFTCIGTTGSFLIYSKNISTKTTDSTTINSLFDIPDVPTPQSTNEVLFWNGSQLQWINFDPNSLYTVKLTKDDTPDYLANKLDTNVFAIEDGKVTLQPDYAKSILGSYIDNNSLVFNDDSKLQVNDNYLQQFLDNSIDGKTLVVDQNTGKIEVDSEEIVSEQSTYIKKIAQSQSMVLG